MQMDEKIIGIINRLQQDETETARLEAHQKYVREGVLAGTLKLDDQTLHFDECSLLDGAVRMRLPTNFTLMEPEQAALKYPSARRPNLIYTDPSTTVNISFNHTATPLVVKDLEAFKQTMMQTIRKMQSSVRFLNDGVVQSNNQPAGFFEFISPALDSDIYNLACFTPLAGRALLITFNCFEAGRPLWQPIAHGILATLQLAH